MKRSAQYGFTVVELLVVIVVIFILTAIGATLFTGAQTQARDTKIRDTADKIADGIKLYMASNNGALPPGGAGSSTAPDPTNGCVNGSAGYASYLYRSGGYTCTIGDHLVALKYLSADLFNNIASKAVLDPTALFYVQKCGTTYFLAYVVEQPTQKEIDEFAADDGSGICNGSLNSLKNNSKFNAVTKLN